VKTIVGHGQMEGEKLEQIMLDFVNGEYDVLLATTIIESGLDIPNANTIIVNDAHHFGLSDLHQLRGRVGRSNKKAYCYLLAPPKHTLTKEARQRLYAIEEFSDLGSGFNIAMQDLDIRGAGNLLGAEQSGFISDIGYETYQKILDEALLELKETEYKELFSPESDNEQITINRLQDMTFVSDCVVETDLELLFPDWYIESTKERVKMYRELDNIETEEDLELFKEQLRDRFGIIPPQSIELIEIVRLRKKAIALGIEKIILKNATLLLYFISNQDSAYYQSSVFGNVLQYVQQNPTICNMKESNGKLTLRFKNIHSITHAIELIECIV
jgi:transcription-repair coupling factor (superfamily II helicase)